MKQVLAGQAFATTGLDFFVKSCEMAGIETLHENRYPPAEYKTDYLAFIEKYRKAAESVAGEIALNYPASKTYAKGKPEELSNRLVGETDYRYNWLGFQGNNLMATVSVPNKSVSEISVGFLQDQASWVFFPEKVVFEVSSDGKKFRKIYEEKIAIQADGKKAVRQVSTRFKARKLRYVRVTAQNIGLCPKWHTCNGNPCWIFADEIILR
jgi:hypothetical protein